MNSDIFFLFRLMIISVSADVVLNTISDVRPKPWSRMGSFEEQPSVTTVVYESCLELSETWLPVVVDKEVLKDCIRP